MQFFLHTAHGHFLILLCVLYHFSLISSAMLVAELTLITLGLDFPSFFLGLFATSFALFFWFAFCDAGCLLGNGFLANNLIIIFSWQLFSFVTSISLVSSCGKIAFSIKLVPSFLWATSCIILVKLVLFAALVKSFDVLFAAPELRNLLDLPLALSPLLPCTLQKVANQPSTTCPFATLLLRVFGPWPAS